MNDHHASMATALDSAPVDDAKDSRQTGTVSSAADPSTPLLEFVGSSDDTIAEAVRRALSHASMSLHTLDGAGVVVIPQIERHGGHSRFHVTLRILPHTTSRS